MENNVHTAMYIMRTYAQGDHRGTKKEKKVGMGHRGGAESARRGRRRESKRSDREERRGVTIRERTTRGKGKGENTPMKEVEEEGEESGGSAWRARGEGRQEGIRERV